MTSQIDHLETRIKTLNAVLTGKQHKTVDAAVREAGGDLAAAMASLKEKLPAAALKKLALAHSLADWSGDNASIVKTLAARPDVASLRDVALRFNLEKLTALVHSDSESLSADRALSGDSDEQRSDLAGTLYNKLFAAEPTAVLQRMVLDAEVPIHDAAVRDGVVTFLDSQPDFNIRSTSVLTAIKHPRAFEGIDEQHRPAVLEHLKTLQRVQAIVPTPDAVPTLIKANLTSAFLVGEMPESAFVRSVGPELGEANARVIHANAVNTRIRNEQALMGLREVVRGTGLAIIDGAASREERLALGREAAAAMNLPVDLESLFGSIDYCECDDCLSIYSPAAYFVELLQYLRNNNLDPKKKKADAKDITGTPLEMLFRRRPDLGCLELTCQNTYTVLPYIDLVNEVLESFIVHAAEYAADARMPKQATLEAFNVDDETTGELLSEPQHLDDNAYRILKDQVYPFTLPYHQPIDAIRIFLDYLGSSRYELLDTFRSPAEPQGNLALTPALLDELQVQHRAALDRAVDAETLGLTEEEFVILTHEKFWAKRYFEILQKKSLTDTEYAAIAHVRSVNEYFGLMPADDLAATLTQVKRELLPRTGLLYVDLVELLKTRFINPSFPRGEALVYMESIRTSYRYLKSLMRASADPSVRFADLIAVLEKGSELWPILDARLHPNPCRPATVDPALQRAEIRKWVICQFEKIGKLIVLESGDGPRLPMEGAVFAVEATTERGIIGRDIGFLNRDGSIVQVDADTGKVKRLGHVEPSGKVVKPNGNRFFEGDFWYEIRDPNQQAIGFIFRDSRLVDKTEQPVRWLINPESCNLDKVRLVHLDETPVTVDEFDRIQRFIRLWRKLGWTIDEVDQALVGLAPKSGFSLPSEDECDDFEATRVPATITADFLHLLAAVRKLRDQTGLELPKLLALWDDIGRAGTNPLYARLFLTHNLVRLDPVFKPDSNGHVLTAATTLSDHAPVLMAALHLKATDLDSIRTSVPLTDALTLENVSAIYRRVVLAKLLGIRVSDLPKVVDLVGDPFASPAATLALLDFWDRMADSGFTLTQLHFLTRRYDPTVPAGPVSPLTPSPRTVLQLSKALYDGLTAIDRNHPDVTGEVSAELVRASVGLVFDPAVVEQVVSLLDGTTGYSTNAPAGLSIVIPELIGGTNDHETLAIRLKYATKGTGATASGSIQVTGILTIPEMTRAKALSANPGWAQALDRLEMQRSNIFDDYLSIYFDNVPTAMTALLGGDIVASPANSGTAPSKRLFFLIAFLPRLRRALSRRLIIETLSDSVGLSRDVTEVLLAEILTIGVPAQPALTLLETIHDQPASSGPGWSGYLIPPADSVYVFTAIGDLRPNPLVIDGRSVPFAVQQEDPNNVWSSDPGGVGGPVKLSAGKLYSFTITDRQPTDILWRSDAAPRATIPTSALLPDHSTPGLTEMLLKFKQLALVVRGFSLNADEIRYWHQPGAGLDFNALTRPFWQRLQAYTALRDGLPKQDRTLLDLFAWSAKPDDPTKLSAMVAGTTGWSAEAIGKLIAKPHYDLDRPEAFRDETELVRLKTALAAADRIGMDVNLLFNWAKPTSGFGVCRKIADSIRAAVRSRFTAEDYEQAVKPLHDRLRRDQRDALVAYLVVQPALIEWGVVDADSLFEFFLIDSQMDCCLQTSRMKQGISSVQSFVQRCMLGLEDGPRGVPPHVLDRGRWEWLSREVIRTANRKVYVNPENYLVSSLRDDKSPFYKELESELLQKDLNSQTISDILTSYIHKVSDVANLKVVGLYAEEGLESGRDPFIRKLHIFSRTRNAPFLYFYRTFDLEGASWTPWSKVEVDIPNYDLTENDVVKDSSTYLLPLVWQNRLFLFFPQIIKKTQAPATGGTTHVPSDGKGGMNLNAPKPAEYWDVSMAWSEYRNGKWVTKQLSTGSNRSAVDAKLPDVSRFKFTTFIERQNFSTTEVVISAFDQSGAPRGGFRFNGSHLYAGLGMNLVTPPGGTTFEYLDSDDTDFFSTQMSDVSDLFRPSTVFGTPHFRVRNEGVTLQMKNGPIQVSHSRISQLLQRMSVAGVDGFYQSLASFGSEEDLFGTAPPAGSFHELSMPNAIYNWEIGFHVPMAIVDRLLKSQQFEAALKVCHYIFNPLAPGSASDRCWIFPPFQEIKADTTMTDTFAASPNGATSRSSPT
jgi:hypothetical protein